MKKLTLSLIVTLFCAGAMVQAQSLEEVLNNYHETMGQEKLLSTKCSMSKGKVVQMGMEIPFVQYASAKNQFRVEATMQGLTLVQVFNGEKGWALNPFAGQTEPQPMSEEELKSMKVQADYEGMLYNWEEKGHKVTLEENEEVDGADCYVVKTITQEGDEITTYIDSENYVALKSKIKTTRMGQEVETETIMSNYQEHDGYVYAAKVETLMNGQSMTTIVIDEMTFDPEIDMSIFEGIK